MEWPKGVYIEMRNMNVITTHVCHTDRQGYHASRVVQDYVYSVVYIRYFGREITKYTVIYSAYIRFWPTLHVSQKHTFMFGK
jgi:hypothetical protein